MISRITYKKLEKALMQEPAVALIGPRQVGKTTLALEIAKSRPSHYLDLEAEEDRQKLANPAQYLATHSDKLVILDEIHKLPSLFEALRGIIDERRRQGQDAGQFLILGSASIDLMRQSETLAGRIAYVDLGPLNVVEIANDAGLGNIGLGDIDRLWQRGGFPRSFLSLDDDQSFERRLNFNRTFLERDIPMFGPRIPAETLRRLWTMLAHNQGTLLNAANLARSLSVSSPTIASYIDLLVDLLMVRRLPPFHANIGKRLVKSPKTYIRDSGILHTLLKIETGETLHGHPIVGASWEGFAIENLIAVAPRRTEASFYRTAAGAEIDLLLDLGGATGLWAIEIKRGLTPKTGKGFTTACDDIGPDKTFIVYGGSERYPKAKSVEVISLQELAQELAAL